MSSRDLPSRRALRDRVAARRAVSDEMRDLQANVAARIFEAMDRNDVSQAALARHLGVSRSRVSQMLSGEQNLTLNTVVEVAFALGHEVEVHVTPRV